MTDQDPPAPDPTEQQFALGRALEQVAAMLRRTRPASTLSATGLSSLDRLERGGPLRITELAAREGVSQPAMTALVNRLEGLGYAERSADPSDGRAALVAITEPGRRRLADHRANRARRLAERLARLDPADQRALAAALPALEALTAAPDAVPVFTPAPEEIVHA